MHFRYLQSECGCSLILRDGAAERTAREWLEQACDIPQYMDPFSRGADLSAITPKKPPIHQQWAENSEVRIFLFMKDKLHMKANEDENELFDPEIKPPWDISTNIKTPPKYLMSGLLNPARLRPSSASSTSSCHHYKGGQTVRPFSAPCGYPEFSAWKHPLDIKPYLRINDISNSRHYKSVSDLSAGEGKLQSRENNSRLLSARSSKGVC